MYVFSRTERSKPHSSFTLTNIHILMVKQLSNLRVKCLAQGNIKTWKKEAGFDPSD